LRYRFWRAGSACLVIGLLSYGVQVLRAWLLWLLSFGMLSSVPGSYGYSGFGVHFSVPGSYVVTLNTRGLRAEGAGRWGKTFTASEARFNGDCRLPGFPVMGLPDFLRGLCTAYVVFTLVFPLH
jgi:hypothetical protein